MKRATTSITQNKRTQQLPVSVVTVPVSVVTDSCECGHCSLYSHCSCECGHCSLYSHCSCECGHCSLYSHCSCECGHCSLYSHCSCECGHCSLHIPTLFFPFFCLSLIYVCTVCLYARAW